MAYASELGMDVRLLWLHAFVLWLENEPVLDEESQERDSGGAQATADLGRWLNVRPGRGRCLPGFLPYDLVEIVRARL